MLSVLDTALQQKYKQVGECPVQGDKNKLDPQGQTKRMEIVQFREDKEQHVLQNVKGTYRKETQNQFFISVADRITNNHSKERSDWTGGMRKGLNGSEALQQAVQRHCQSVIYPTIDFY